MKAFLAAWSLQLMLVHAQEAAKVIQQPILVGSDFQPSVVTVTRSIEVPASSPAIPAITNMPDMQGMSGDGTIHALSIIEKGMPPGKSLTQCAVGVKCQLPPLSAVTTVYDTTSTYISNSTKTVSTSFTNVVVEYYVSVVEEVVEQVGFCTTDITHSMPLLVVTVAQNVTDTHFYLTEVTSRSTTTTRINVTSSHGCTQSAPAATAVLPGPTSRAPVPSNAPGPGNPDQIIPGDRNHGIPDSQDDGLNN